jgi:hypothetical protein
LVGGIVLSEDQNMIELNWINSGYTWTATHEGETFEIVEELDGTFSSFGPSWFPERRRPNLGSAQEQVAEAIEHRSEAIMQTRYEEQQAFYRGWERV